MMTIRAVAGRRGPVRAASLAAVGCVWAFSVAGAAVARTAAAPQEGAFSDPFVEPHLEGAPNSEECDESKKDAGRIACKPAAGSMAVLPGGRVVYFNALEGTENITTDLPSNFGTVSVNDQTRVMNPLVPSWLIPSPADGGANPDGYETEPLVPPLSSTEAHNDGALFCSDLEFLADGRLLATGGTAYYNDPGTEGAGLVELEGLRNARIFDPKTNRWTQTGDMKYGRWYPSMVTLPNGDIFVASGVQKLAKPIYPNHAQDSGRNIVHTETYIPRQGKFVENGPTADRSLPLYPRLHLLPNGHVYYSGGGQAFNPLGQSYDEVLWNMAAAYDPEAKAWTDLGVARSGSLVPGFRGSTFSIMLPLRADDDGRYTKTEFLTAGGVVGTTPGSYLPVPISSITTVDTGDGISASTRDTGSFAESRWYSTGVLLPTGEVAVFSGATRDEVVTPGMGNAIRRAEMFDPETETWVPLAAAGRERTYHNTAALLPDGRVLVGGHAPITTMYGAPRTVPGGFSPNDRHDPTFELYSPPYLWRGPRPVIKSAPAYVRHGGTLTIGADLAGGVLEKVVLVRNTSLTHLIDGDQRSVELRILKTSGRAITVAAPPGGEVAPPGPYMLFVVTRGDDGLVPSTARQVFVRA